jgi:hypothetical protein
MLMFVESQREHYRATLGFGTKTWGVVILNKKYT